MKARRVVAFGIVALVLSAVVGACSGNDSESAGGGDGANGMAQAEAPARAPGSNDGAYDAIGESGSADRFADASTTTSGGGGGGSVDNAAPLPEFGLKVIKTASLDIEIEGDALKDAVQDATTLAERLGGFVVSTSLADRDDGSGAVTIRVPAESFAQAIAGVRGIGDVKRESVSGRDVTAEYIDLEARLRNMTAQEAVLLKLMADAVSVTDTIRVQGELQAVQLEIERLKGRIRFLNDQTAMSTIDVGFREKGAVVHKTSTLGRAWERAGQAFLGLVSATIIGGAVVVPLLVMLALAIVLILWLRPRFGGWDRPAKDAL